MSHLWRDDGLSLALALLFTSSWALQTWTGWLDFVTRQQGVGRVADMFGADAYVWP